MIHTKYIPIYPLLLLITLVACLIPWVNTPSAALNLGAYDLAEWTSLHPTVRQTAPYLWTTFALRLPFATIGILIADYLAHRINRYTSYTFLVITAAALLPPLEYFTIYRNDINYSQQFQISILILILGVIFFNKRLDKRRPVLLMTLAVIGASASLYGLYQAMKIMSTFEVPVTFGAGGILTLMNFILLIFGQKTKQSRKATLFVQSAIN